MRSQDLERGFLAHPDSGTHPGVVIVPDVWGLSDHYRDLARRLAGEGFCVLAVDIYRRDAPPPAGDVDFALRWIAKLSDPRIVEEIQGGIDLLAAHDAVGSRPVGVTGFCMGGQYAILAACSCRGLAACVPFYGMLAYSRDRDLELKPRAPLDAIADLTCPLLGLYGEEDALIPVSDVRELERRLPGTGHAWGVHLYPGAGHAFMNDTRPQAYRPDAAKDAWRRMVAFFREHLGS